MSLMKHVRNALRTKSPQEKIEGQLRREQGTVHGRNNKSLHWDHENQRVHVTTSKKPFLAGMLAKKREHGPGQWRTKTFHWNDNHKITHYQDWQDQDHWHSGQPPVRRISGVHQPNDRLDHIEEAVTQLPGTTRLKKHDKVTHPDLPGVHVIYSTPPTPEGAMALVYPLGHKFETDVTKDPTGMRGIKRVAVRHLKKVD